MLSLGPYTNFVSLRPIILLFESHLSLMAWQQTLYMHTVSGAVAAATLSEIT